MAFFPGWALSKDGWGDFLGDGAQTAADGIQTAVDGTQISKDGAQTAVDGIQISADGTQTAVDGAQIFVDGIQTSKDGVQTVADGVQIAKDGIQIAKIGLHRAEYELQTTKGGRLIWEQWRGQGFLIGKDATPGRFTINLVDLEPSDSRVGWRISRSRHPRSGAVLETEATFVAFPA